MGASTPGDDHSETGPVSQRGWGSVNPGRERRVQHIADRYEPLEVIASGGMATVWRARDHRLDRLVALKRPLPGLAMDTAGIRMDREARAAAALSHPNLVTIYDYGSDDDGPYLVMELLDGPTLQEAMGELEAGSAVQIGAQLADGLSAIHRAGIVHRDVKPANVIMSAHGPQLTDFGIATDPTLVGDITDPGHVVATPSYAAPEVLRGEDPTPASDVYSLAAVIAEVIDAKGVEVDPALRPALASAQSNTPGDRPTADEFGAALRSATPTVLRPAVGGGSTLLLETTPAGADHAHKEESRSGLWPWVVALVAFGAVGMIALGVALAGDEPNADASASPGAFASTTSTTSTTLHSTTTRQSVSTTRSGSDDLDTLTNQLEAVLLEPPRSDLNPSEVEDLMKNVDEAVVLAGDGKEKEAEKRLSEVAKRIDDEVDDGASDEALEVLTEIADMLGLDFETRDHRDDD